MTHSQKYILAAIVGLLCGVLYMAALMVYILNGWILEGR